MINLKKLCAGYIGREFLVISSISLDGAIREFYKLEENSVLEIDNFFDTSELDTNNKKINAIYYKPRLGFLGHIEVVKDFCQKHNIIFIEDFTENFSANKIIDGKSLYAGTFGDVSVCVKNNAFLYATDNKELERFLRSALRGTAIRHDNALDVLLLNSINGAEIIKHKRRIVVANYMSLINYLGLFLFLKPVEESKGEMASYPVFAITAVKVEELWQYLTQAGIMVELWNTYLLLPTDITDDELRYIMELIAKFYTEVRL